MSIPPLHPQARAKAALFILCASLRALSLSALPGGLGLSQTVMTVWTDREGLPSDTILDVVQDGQGYVWLGSYDGLVRFDGESFTTLSPEEGGFSGRSARVLTLGPDGSLWVGTNTAGLYKREGRGFVAFGKEIGLPDLSVRAIAFDRAGRIWVGTASGVSYYDGSKFVSVNAPLGIANFILPLSDGGVLVGSNLQGLWVVDEKGAAPFLPGLGFESHSFSSAYLDPRNELWLGTSLGSIYRVARNELVEAYEPAELKGASINEFFADPEGSLWIATDKGIVSRRGGEYLSFTESNGLPSNVVSALWRDREGSLWAATERGGIVKFSPGKFVNLSRRDGLVSDSVNAVAEDEWGGIWVATDEGVSFLPSVGHPYKLDEKRRAAVNGVVAALKGIRVRQVRMEPDGSVWFSTYSDKALYVLEPDGRTRSIGKKDGLPIDRVRFSYRGGSGQLWIGTTAGPARLAAEGVEVFGKDRGLPNLFILCALESRSGQLWLGTDGGGAARLRDGSFTVFGPKDGLAGSVVFRIFEDKARRLWFCTSEGLSLLQGERFLTVGAELGLAKESVFETLEDPQGRLWILLGRRVIIVSADELAAFLLNPGSAAPRYRVYDRLDGLAGQLTANAWASVSRTGVVHLPTLKGLSTYNPQSVPQNNLPPPVLVEAVMVDGQSLVPGPDGIISLKPGVRRLSFRYTALSFMIPQRVRFRCMLEGYDKDWIQAGTRREIGYSGLPPGEYRFKVLAENNDGVMNEEGAIIPLRQEPFFTQTLPFYILLALLLVGIGFLIAYLRVRRLEARSKELSRLVDERTAELAASKAVSDGLLLNVLPASIADELKTAGRAEPKIYPDASVLFADIVGFTPRAASMPPELLIEELNEVFTLFDDTMAEFGCERIKTIGDGYLAAAGLPIPAQDHAQRLVKAGSECLRRLEARNRSQDKPVRVRMAVNSGVVVGGVVGVKKYIFDIFGDTVNTAFRLQGFSCPMGLTISAETASRLGQGYPLLARPAREAKGKGKLVSFYLRYREGVPSAGRSHLEAFKAAKEQYDASSFSECVSVLNTLDLSVVEPELGRSIYNLKGNALFKLGDKPAADASWAAAVEFGEPRG